MEWRCAAEVSACGVTGTQIQGGAVVEVGDSGERDGGEEEDGEEGWVWMAAYCQGWQCGNDTLGAMARREVGGAREALTDGRDGWGDPRLRFMCESDELRDKEARLVSCRLCPRLRLWTGRARREREVKRQALQGGTRWGTGGVKERERGREGKD